MARSDDTLTALPDYATAKKLPQLKRVGQLLVEGHQLRRTMAEADERLKEIKAELSQIQLANDLPGVRYGEMCFIAVEREGKRSLSKEALIDNGVDLDVIEASMRQGNSYVETRLEVIGEAARKKMEKEMAEMGAGR